MDKVKRPRGLIRYDSYEGIKDGVKLKFNARILGYSAILMVLITVLVLLFVRRAPLEATILRTPGVLYQELPDGRVSNLYNIKVVNKTFDEKKITLELLYPEGSIDLVGGGLVAPPGNLCETSFFVKIDREQIQFRNTTIALTINSEGEVVKEIRTSFPGPMTKKGNK